MGTTTTASTPAPSRRHDALAWLVPRLRRATEIASVEDERQRLLDRHAPWAGTGRHRPLPTALVPRFDRRFAVVEERWGDFPAHVLTVRGAAPRRTVVYVHGGGFIAPIDPFHVRYAARLARDLDARVVLPDHPLAPEADWRASHDDLVAGTARWARLCADRGEPLLLAGDSAGGGLALAVALGLQQVEDAPPVAGLVLHAPWVDLTTSTADTAVVALEDPWLKLTKLVAYADWWAGRPEDLGRPEVSPALTPLDRLSALPPALVLCGTRDLLVPGCRLLARRAADAGWDLRYLERPGLIHVFGLLPLVPEAAWAHAEVRRFVAEVAR